MDLPHSFRYLSVLLAGIAQIIAATDAVPEWRVGIATRNLTPDAPIWLAGYANRTLPSNGVDLDVLAKALALDDGHGGRIVIVTLDLVAVPRSLREYVEKEGARQYQLQPHEILLNASHTHSAPQVPADRMVLERSFSRAATPARRCRRCGSFCGVPAGRSGGGDRREFAANVSRPAPVRPGAGRICHEPPTTHSRRNLCE